MLFADTEVDVARCFRVTWRNRASGSTYRVGNLSQLVDGTYRFVYAEDVENVPGFPMFLGFPDARRRYESRRLWALFALRAMDPRRPDYHDYLTWLGLDQRASTLDVLSRSGGERKGDSVQLVELPRADADGRSQVTFLVRGSRYATGSFGTREQVSGVQPGQRLVAVADLGNPANPRAHLVTTSDDAALGWVPDGLLDHLVSVEKSSRVLTLVRNNGSNSPWHLRFLVTLTGQVDASLAPDCGPTSG